MARELTKLDKNGERYRRPPTIEATIDAALTQDLSTLQRRASVHNRSSPDFLPPEALVHLIREARRRDDTDTMNSLLRPLLARCARTLRSKVHGDELPNPEAIREEILSQFAELFAIDGTSEGADSLDFYEVRFNLAFRTLRIDEVRRETRRLSRHPLIQDLASPQVSEEGEGEELSDEDILADLSSLARSQPQQIKNIFLGGLVPAINALPLDERRAVILCHHLGLPVESDDPDRMTAAKACGVTGRTIRNRLASAKAKLAAFKGGIS